MNISSFLKLFAALVCILLAFVSLPATVECAKKASGPSAPEVHEPVIEEVTQKQLERILQEKDYVAVYWYARSCLTCDKVLAELEKIDDDTDSFGVDFVKINDKRLAKQYGIKNFPALTYFREKEPIIYDGDLMDEEGVLDFLTSLEAMDLPDRIEEVNAKILAKIIEETDYVAVLFYKPECKRCTKALQELENIDDEADQLDIGFVKIHDEALADEYNLGALPALVYYRHQIPILYEGELSKEEDVLEWLIENKSTGDDEEVIEDVTAKTLSTLIGNVDNLVVLFYDHGIDDSMTVLEELEKIDDDCDKHGIQFVKIDDDRTSRGYGIESVPAIVYFEKQVPNIYSGDLLNEEEILHWLVSQTEKDEIEDVTEEALDKMVKDGDTLAVLFYDNNDDRSQKVLEELENIDDECDALGINFVKIDNTDEAKEYGIDSVPSLLYFEKGIPTVFEGRLEDEEAVLKWLEQQTTSESIEDVTDEMLDLILEKMQYVAVLFYDKDQKKSQKVLNELENIDDECDQNDIAFVKIDDDKEAEEWGIDEIPTIVFYERGIPHIYEGDLMKEEDLLGWLIHQKRHSEIPEVTDEMKDKLVESTKHLAVIFYDKDDKQDMRVLNELENIDDELEKEGIVIVRIDNADEAKEYGLDHLPALVYFEDKIPALYEGDLMNEDEVLEWLIVQKETATIEEVTDEILKDLIEDHEYVVAYFTGPCEEGDRCDDILDDLENIDDELDEAGIIFVTTEDTVTAKKLNIKTFPQLVFFRNRDPLFYKGDLEDEDEVLSWLTDENTLEIPGKIEEVNSKMLEKILGENDHVVVFFYREGDKKAQKILNELENIDDECEEKNIDFVKTSDEGIDKEYDLAELPALAFYRNKFRTIYSGDLMKEDEILEWVLDLYESNPDVIESVDRKTLQVLINDVEHLAVFFYDDKCASCPSILEELETIDDDTDEHGIQFVKSNDVKLAHEIGIFAFPALVYYETGVPIMYDGNLKNEKRVLQWLINQKSATDDDADSEKVEDCGTDATANRNAFERIRSANKKLKRPANRRTISNKLGSDQTYSTANNDDNFSSYGNDIDDIVDSKQTATPAAATQLDIHFMWIFLKDLLTSLVSTNDHNETNENTNDINFELNTHCDYLDDSNYLTIIDGDLNDDDNSQKHKLLEQKLLDDECFYVGMAHQAQSARKGNNYVPNDYRPFQCCPTKLERQTRVPKMSAQKLSHQKDSDDKSRKSQFEFNDAKSSSSSSSSKSASGSSSRKSDGKSKAANESKYSSSSSSKKSSNSKKSKQNNDDDDDIVVPVKELKKAAPKGKDTNKAKPDDPEDPDARRILRHIELIDDEASEYGITIVKTTDKLMAKKYGYRKLPGLTYFRKGKNINYDGDIDDEEEILDWLTLPDNMEMTDHIERVNRKMFQKIRQTSDYLAVFLYSDDCKQCPRVLAEIEHIDDEADGAGINFVKIDDKSMAKEFGVFALPAILFFRQHSKEPVIYAGDLYEEDQILNWLMTQKDPGGDVIEDLEGQRLIDLIAESGSMAVYFWNKTLCDICSSKTIRKARMKKEKEAPPTIIEPPSTDNVDELATTTAPPPPPPTTPTQHHHGTHDEDTDDCEQCTKTLEELENIDDDCDRHGITFVKTKDFSVAEQFGVHDFPALVYFESSIPNVFEGQLNEEEEVLQWLITQKTEDRIELITRQMLETMVEDTQYLAVYFSPERFQNQPSYCRSLCSPLPKKLKIKDSQNPLLLEYLERKKQIVEKQDKINCNICDQILEGLELIDDECDVFGIHMVKIQDPQLAKRYSIKTFPALVYFRNGNPLLFEGDMQNEQSVLEWLIDDDNRELADEIEEVNDRMLERLLDESSLLVVFFYEEDCAECEEILEELEQIDGEADMFGIDFVKIASHEAAQKYEVSSIPALVYFRKQVPMLYDGDLHQHDRILTWLTSQDVFEIKNEIEEVNRKMLDKLLEENEFLAVYFYEADHPDSTLVLEKLENIDSETDNLDITFVKMSDSRYARKWGVTKLPAIVYFRKRFPSIYRGDLLSEDEVLEWLRKNRFRQPELNIFMYALIAISVAFVLYTAFLLQCFKPPPSPAPSVHVKQQ
ncbi:uncharacterized protein LOC129577457 isoform X3 [Sitodiplosis mosellana]|uniref:uncharacterized protein LOC129577457 isoform X3 n=1 Tax=Sitodiplosis mosellana TaxID=263140 RepID=UPI0024453531|nr:uncharacterized protein LOC129577457 isoform X3 [Sitodiplosis mosellana]